MKILEDLLACLDFEAAARDIRQGPFQTAVLPRYCGLASTPHDPGPHHSRFAVDEAGRLLEKSAREILQAQFIIGDPSTGGSKSNVWQGTADLLVVPELA